MTTLYAELSPAPAQLLCCFNTQLNQNCQLQASAGKVYGAASAFLLGLLSLSNGKCDFTEKQEFWILPSPMHIPVLPGEKKCSWSVLMLPFSSILFNIISQRLKNSVHNTLCFSQHGEPKFSVSVLLPVLDETPDLTRVEHSPLELSLRNLPQRDPVNMRLNLKLKKPQPTPS